MTASHIATLQQLAIFETHRQPGGTADPDSAECFTTLAQPSGAAAAAAAGGQRLQQRYLPPEGVPKALLGPSFLQVGQWGEGQGAAASPHCQRPGRLAHPPGTALSPRPHRSSPQMASPKPPAARSHPPAPRRRARAGRVAR
jgi:hypothetical protein